MDKITRGETVSNEGQEGCGHTDEPDQTVTAESTLVDNILKKRKAPSTLVEQLTPTSETKTKSVNLTTHCLQKKLNSKSEQVNVNFVCIY